ncbi:hypothetical protein PoB_006139300 [Plakobranchus ocellatus]|uniref:Uncharacterized protein n=1 Tax=Plakobranchus ocellatus TaxID=259542 RepID=A0AAV4CSH5_9GAST|nr:hypothetical protein PoB_006139300 [Plakobranchus ocellatus]
MLGTRQTSSELHMPGPYSWFTDAWNKANNLSTPYARTLLLVQRCLEQGKQPQYSICQDPTPGSATLGTSMGLTVYFFLYFGSCVSEFRSKWGKGYLTTADGHEAKACLSQYDYLFSRDNARLSS